MSTVFERPLNHTAANMTAGPFGAAAPGRARRGASAGGGAGAQGDAVCVQSLDGQLSFFEAGGAAGFARHLPGFLVPGPLCYWCGMPAWGCRCCCSCLLCVCCTVALVLDC